MTLRQAQGMFFNFQRIRPATLPRICASTHLPILFLDFRPRILYALTRLDNRKTHHVIKFAIDRDFSKKNSE